MTSTFNPLFMKKNILLIPILSLISIMMLAVPARRGVWRTLQLTDGSTVRAMLAGDEHVHFWQDADGNAYRQAGDNVYARIDRATVADAAKVRRAKANAVRRQVARRAAKDTKIFQGSRRGLIILVQFSDKKFSMSNPKAFYNRVANELNYREGNFKGSVRDYFRAQSNNQFDLSFDITGPVTLQHPYSYYGQNDSKGNDLRAEYMIKEAVQAIGDTTNFSPYDWDGDKEVEEVFVLYAGYGEADSDDEYSVWPHMYDFYSSGLGVQIYNGYKINVYACSNEISYNDDAVAGIGTICHEFSHCMGFPDVYDVSYDGNFGMQGYDLMDYGSYNGDGFQPANYTAYERMTCGWTMPVELKADTTVTGMASLTDHGQTYIIYNPDYKNEFYMLENRQPTGFDASLPGKGMLISYIDYDAKIWDYNVPNSFDQGNDHQRITLFHADNSIASDTYRDYTEFIDVDTDLYPYNDNDSLTPTSKPAATLYHARADGSKLMPYAITAITQNADGTMSFSFAPRSTVGNVIPAQGNVLFRETFDKCNGSGGNDGAFSKNVASANFQPDNEGWTATYTDCMYGGNQCARFNKSKKAGIVTSPSFTLTGDTATLSFRAAAWDAKDEGTSLRVQINGIGSILNVGKDTLLTMTRGEWQTYTMKLTGKGVASITFDPAKRFFLDDVTVTVPDNATAIRAVTMGGANGRVADGHYYSLGGIDMGTSLRALPKGIYIINGRKIVK